MQTQQRSPRTVQLLFFFLPTKPKADGIFWCIIKTKDKATEEEDMGYSYIEYKDGEFIVPINEHIEFTVEGWCELIHPTLLFQEPKKESPIIKSKIIGVTGSKFLPRRN